MTTRAILRRASAFWSDEQGVTSLEYALIAVLIGVAIVGAVGNVGEAAIALYQDVAQKVMEAAP